MKSFRLRNGKNVEVEREIKTLKLINVENTDYYKGKNPILRHMHWQNNLLLNMLIKY